jgi:hypothetical protein
MASQVHIKRISQDHVHAINESAKGYCYAVTYAASPGKEPSEEMVRKAWREDRRDFKPYDWSAGRYC